LSEVRTTRVVGFRFNDLINPFTNVEGISESLLEIISKLKKLNVKTLGNDVSKIINFNSKIKNQLKAGELFNQNLEKGQEGLIILNTTVEINLKIELLL